MVGLTWSLAAQQVSKDMFCFTLTSEDRQVQWLPLLDWGQVMVIPTEVKSPVGLMASLGRPTASCSVCVLQTEAARTVLVHAARNCFWTLKADILSKVAASLGHMDHPKHLPELVPMLIRAILGDLPEAQMQEILALRGWLP